MGSHPGNWFDSHDVELSSQARQQAPSPPAADIAGVTDRDLTVE